MEIIIPELSESITEATISAWMKKAGEAVKIGDVLLELETDKVNLEINAQADGILEKILIQAGETVHVGDIVGAIIAGEAQLPEQGQTAASEKPEVEKAESQAPIKSESIEKSEAAVQTKSVGTQAAKSELNLEKASPSMRKLARENGTDLSNANQSAESSKGTESNESPTVSKSMSTPTETVIPVVDVDPTRPVERQRMSRRRITIAKRLVEAQRTAAMLTTFNEVDMTAILDIRKRRKHAFLEKHEVGLGFMSFFVKAVVGALKAFPMLNAEIDKEEIVLKQYYDIGIAVSAKEGLVVPVVRGVDRLNFAEIERQIGDLAGKARANSLALADLQGGTFTITNGGVFGSLFSTPILNAPQVGILGMHTIQKRPIAVDDVKVEVRPMMYIALSYDHRIVDGSEAVRFLVTVKELLEDPESLLLEG
ncbi:2-oxoglutarate dehydrogenase complex dihydrolipoyllysine-residue succinyltransferase [Paenibacillus psychroresistens]|uniref:Dihydrolipoyllysine-residue succinyltransferase n=1 Tax=Paenibacillus psychroresistens TaxID=1778678 RepID=A0A6B8RE23_9BACL|nr:2-oxoglutarate dehydrogenase complex dihydrolipoyllysine-residue succinyltransferase [Paenibacillus psychroresistens]QGQ94711.1 2-oxoglutarate dehydrogenase complex dihydrolipoyllysine-residue succinyltransferase [Paenibacillus psychroresistens]